MKNIIVALIFSSAVVSADSIVNPNPPSAGKFNKLWVTEVSLHLPSGTSPGYITAKFAPYDGQNILGNGGVVLDRQNLVSQMASDQTFSNAMVTLQVELARQATNTSGVVFVDVKAPQPGLPVRAVAQFLDGKSWGSEDCYQQAATDVRFAAVFVGTMAEIARQSGLNVQP